MSFEIKDGETVGFLGLNGAGKTTALRILACDLRPSGGTISIGEADAVADPHSVRQQIGFLPENPPLYQDMTVSDYLFFAGQLRGMSRGEVDRRLPTVLAVTHLQGSGQELIGHLSHGYRQRVGVAQAIIHNPTLLILDEPTRGLDPVQIVEMRNLIHELKENHTVLISSHILTEISQTCDRLLVLGAGEIIASGTEKELTTGLAEVKSITVIVRADSTESSPYRGSRLKDKKEKEPAKESTSPKDSQNESSKEETKDQGKDNEKKKETKEKDRDKAADGEEAESPKNGADPVAGCIEAVEGVKSVTSATAPYEDARIYHISCTSDVRAEVSRAIVKAGHDLLKLDHGQSELESTFLKLVQGDSDASN
ncbi:MAG: ABC transporter ATP-binding protein [Proteobacteria bacterium]|nr:ABC transporter ATP-binding protein [Pseudomonadota bacterium]